MGGSGVDPARVAALKSREDAAFVEMRPRSKALWASGHAVMPNGEPGSPDVRANTMSCVA